MNQPGPGISVNHHAWVLVAGTGLRSGVPHDVCLMASAVGESIARFDCGLVTGGWAGVDYIVADAFASQELKKGNRLEDRLVQVIREDRDIELQAGRVVRTKVGPLEWLEPQSYCDAVVLIGGLGGAYGAFLSALHKGIPRFPLGGTGGDAARAFQHMCELWDVMPNPGISKWQFEALGQPVESREEAVDLADGLLPLVIASIRHRKGRVPRSVFLSYSRRDADWMRRVAATLRPIEHSGRAQVWSDINIEAGSQWDAELHRKMSVCDIAVLLVSPSFLASSYVRNVELPVLLERARAGRTRLFWVAITPCAWEETELCSMQAALDPTVPLSELSAADVQVALVELRQQIDRGVV